MFSSINENEERIESNDKSKNNSNSHFLICLILLENE